ncbi:hypothetical protein Krac_4817 [Ktedonobacter racemifer DSM 44963]|uniref:Uncharacterized protein n=1 Tax=Ktedonobacter racemifer DSM 44963 TaxID=485913 RepID=D6TTR9_KTERA|nr:hypothetical protein Krac_4817 [Ktedonobacter racemifer DSM 44963]
MLLVFQYYLKDGHRQNEQQSDSRAYTRRNYQFVNALPVERYQYLLQLGG